MKDFRLLSRSNLLAWLEFLSRTLINAYSGAFKEGVWLHFQPEVRFREYFIYLLMKEKSKKKINHSEGAENIDFIY